MRRGSLPGSSGAQHRSPVTLAIISWNTRELLRRCLESVAPEAQAGRVEAWVVDNASEDGSAALVREQFPWVELIASNENLGFGAAVNLVAERTATTWLAIANADTELPPGTIERLLERGEELPQAGILAPRLIGPDGATQHSAYAFPTLPFTLGFNLGIGAVSDRWAERNLLIGAWSGERSRWVDWAVGAFLLVRREAWDAIGGFDPAQFMYAEDLDLGWRAAQAGWRTWFESTATVRHQGAASTRQLWGEETDARWLRSTYAWMARRRGIAITRAVALVNTLGAAGRTLALPARSQTMRRWTKLHWKGLLASRSELEDHR